MRRITPRGRRGGQSAVEYMILLGLAAFIAILGFRIFIPSIPRKAEVAFNKISGEILGPPVRAQGAITDGKLRQFGRYP